MPRTMDEIYGSCIDPQQMQTICRNFGMSGTYVEYRPVSDNPHAGLYYVCGTADKVKEVAGNNTYFHDVNHIDPAWVARREQRNPGYFYTDVFALNVSNMPTVVALNKVADYAKRHEALHTIFKEFNKPIPKKIAWEDVKVIEELNKGRYNHDYTPELRGIYKERLQKYLDKTFTDKVVAQHNRDADLDGQSNFVNIDYFVNNGDDVRYCTISESDFQYLKKMLESNPDHYRDIKIYAGKLDVVDYGIEKTPGTYNPWANFEDHIETRKIGYRNCDEDIISGIILCNRCAELENITKNATAFLSEPCVAITIPFEFLNYWDSNAKQYNKEYYVDINSVYGRGSANSATIIYHVADEEMANMFINGVMHYTATEHSEFLGKGQQDRVRADIPKGNLEDLIKQADNNNKPAKQKHGLFGRNKDSR